MLVSLPLFAVLLAVLPDAPAVFESAFVDRAFALTADPGRPEWKDAPRVLVDHDQLGHPVPGRPMEVRSRWTKNDLYLLYSCPYETLTLKPGSPAPGETPRLWTWDVAEAFIGSELGPIARYKEFQVSPRGEWVDLDIDRTGPEARADDGWNSGFEVRARIDETAQVWYGEMRIPFSAIDTRPVEVGRQFRLGVYRIEGAEPRTHYSWRVTGQPTFHVPASFGTLRLR